MNVKWTSKLKQRIIRDTERMMTMLWAISSVPAIQKMMKAVGYTEEVHENAWVLLYRALRATRPWELEGEPVVVPQKAACAEVDAFEDKYIPLARLALERHCPEQAKYLFADLKRAEGGAVLGMVHTFLYRRRVLLEGSDPDREPSRAADRAAMELLAGRGLIDDRKAEHLMALIEAATRMAPDPEVIVYDQADEAAYLALMDEVHGWLGEWRESARIAVPIRRYQILMGLAHKRRSPAPSVPAASAAGASDGGPDCPAARVPGPDSPAG